MLYEKERSRDFSEGFKMMFVTCSQCNGTLGALNFPTLHSELSFRGWAVVQNGESVSLYCSRCADARKPERMWRGTTLVFHANQILPLVTQVETEQSIPD